MGRISLFIYRHNYIIFAALFSLSLFYSMMVEFPVEKKKLDALPLEDILNSKKEEWSFSQQLIAYLLRHPISSSLMLSSILVLLYGTIADMKIICPNCLSLFSMRCGERQLIDRSLEGSEEYEDEIKVFKTYEVRTFEKKCICKKCSLPLIFRSKDYNLINKSWEK